MSYAYAPILVGVTFVVSEVLLLSKMANFPFRPWTIYSPWSSKNLIDRNRPKKFMQVWIDELCICTNFGGRSLSGFGDIATLKNGQISLSDHYSPWSSKNLIDRNRPKKFMQVWTDELCICTNFGGRDICSFRGIATLKNGKFPFPTMDYSPWSSKNLIDRNRPKKFMQVWIDELCICTNFGGRSLSGFGDIATLKNDQISLFDHGL